MLGAVLDAQVAPDTKRKHVRDGSRGRGPGRSTVWASRDGAWEAKAYLELDVVRDVDMHKTMGPDGLHPWVLREPLQGHC